MLTKILFTKTPQALRDCVHIPNCAPAEMKTIPIYSGVKCVAISSDQIRGAIISGCYRSHQQAVDAGYIPR